jgi:predicted transport protein
VAISSDSEQMQQLIADMCWNILTAPDVVRIRLNDPRFSWLRSEVNDTDGTTNTLEALLTQLQQQPATDETVSVLKRLHDYAQALQNETVEGELFGIVAASANDPEAVAAIAEELQWDGQSVYRSRTYDSYSKPTKDLIANLSTNSIWVPVLDRALNVIKRAVPIHDGQVGPMLKAAGLAESMKFSALGLLNAQDIFRRPTRLRMTADGIVVSESASVQLGKNQSNDRHNQSVRHVPAKTPEESPAVRVAIRDALARLHRGTGLVQVDDVLRMLRETGIARLSPEGVTSAVTRIPDIEGLDGGWLGMIGSAEVSPLTRRLAKMLLACYRLPLDIAWYQLGRENQLYRHIPPTVIADFARKHPQFHVDGDRVALSAGGRLSQSTLLDPAESKLFNLLRRNARPIVRTEFSSLLGRTTMSAAQRAELLRTSSLVVPMGDDRFTALGPSQIIFERIRSDHREYQDRFPDIALPQTQAPSPAPSLAEDHRSDYEPKALSPKEDQGELHVLSETTASGETTTVLRTIRELLDDIQKNRLRLPEIQRGYVWKSTQVRDLIDSLYRGYPVGTLLIWNTEERPASRSVSAGQSIRTHASPPSSDGFILDGQQRLTSIFRAVVTGETNIVFNVSNESFRVAAARSTTTLTSIPIAEVFAHGPEHVLAARDEGSDAQTLEHYRARLDRLHGILQRVIPVETLSGYSYEEVTDVFIRVNSRGTRLKTAELAIADVAYRLPGMVSDQITQYADDLARRGWEFPVQFLLRLTAAVGTKRVSFKGLSAMSDQEFAGAWERVPTALDTWLELLKSRMKISNGDLLPGINSHLVPAVWFAGNVTRAYDDQLLEWFVHSNVWSRYSGRTESNLDQDLRDLFSSRRGNPFGPLMDRIRQTRSSLRVAPRDVERAGQRSPLLLLMYLALARSSADDLLDGLGGILSDNEHKASNIPYPIFTTTSLRGGPRASTTQQLPNVVLLSPESAAFAGSRQLAQFFEHIPKHRLEQHAIPLDSSLWVPQKYAQFTSQRSRLLVEQMNAVIKDLSSGNLPSSEPVRPAYVSTRTVSTPSRDEQIGFDQRRREIFDEMAAAIHALDPNIKPYNRTTYLGFSYGSHTRPFATVARLRRSVLAWVIDCNMKRLHDPRGWCRDVSKVGKHGYGETQFLIERSDQIPYAMELIKQAFELRKGK